MGKISEQQKRRVHVAEQTSDEVSEPVRFQRYAFLDRPFLTQSAGFDPRRALEEDFCAGARHRAHDEERPGHSVDEVIALLRNDRSNQHFKTGGRPGVQPVSSAERSTRVAGAPLEAP